VHPRHAELSSIASSLAELTERVGAIAEQDRAADPEADGSALHEIERSLNAALRRLDQVLRP
jgi:hypothetical protein